MSRLSERYRSFRVAIGDRFWRTAERLKVAPGAAGEPQPEISSIEGQVQGAFAPVRPSAHFRDHLRDNLTLAAEKRASGLAIESVPAYREGVMLGVVVGVFLAAVATVLVISHTHMRGSQH